MENNDMIRVIFSTYIDSKEIILPKLIYDNLLNFQTMLQLSDYVDTTSSLNSPKFDKEIKFTYYHHLDRIVIILLHLDESELTGITTGISRKYYDETTGEPRVSDNIFKSDEVGIENVFTRVIEMI